MTDYGVPMEARVTERIEEASGLFTLRLELTDPDAQRDYGFEPGQFNMLYLYGVGEIAISIVSDPSVSNVIEHTIRVVGRVTRGFDRLRPGDSIGLRGPFGRGWPVQAAERQDVVIITGGLGCAPVVSVINYIAMRRERYARLNILQGVKHSRDFIWRSRYDEWRALPDTEVLLAADAGDSFWPWHIGRATELFTRLSYDPGNVTVMMCGPEGMMGAAVRHLVDSGVPDDRIWLSMERNMQCGTGTCGHCHLGGHFVCKDGPVFRYADVQTLFGLGDF